MLKPIKFILPSNVLALKDEREYKDETEEAFRELLATFYRCSNCRTVFIFDFEPAETRACVVCGC